VNLAHAGVGSASHLCGLMFQTNTKLEMQTVPYKGTGPAMTDLLGGQVDLMCDQTYASGDPILSRKAAAARMVSTKEVKWTPRKKPSDARAGDTTRS
jgi:tripartite-type tricarboxylate transporter receptor subunit TctC